MISNNNRNNFVLNMYMYITRSSLNIIITYNKIVAHSLFVNSVLGIIEVHKLVWKELHIEERCSITWLGSILTLVALSWLWQKLDVQTHGLSGWLKHNNLKEITSLWI